MSYFEMLYSVSRTHEVQYYLRLIPGFNAVHRYSLFPVPCSLFPVPYSLLPTPYSLLPLQPITDQNKRCPKQRFVKLAIPN
ncbi:hypothetical protein [Moorena sp. SIO3H5]|uniref:hypothetical protein n=1 Tax=Moorena sp. SIO3H5 TaxID=2607834 RepID=UPI0013B67A87|nr:hypothetical protein [Moorena sp. SIO3H5]NEO68327.1 hypothetical protein [Moorena sp. SIO3H5]